VLSGLRLAALTVDCVYCGKLFPSRNKLFKHLQGADGGQACMQQAVSAGMPVVTKPKRVALLIGYIGDNWVGVGSEYQGHGWQSDGIHGALEQRLWEAVSTADGREPPFGKVRSFSRASRTDRGMHAVGNVVAVNAAPLPEGEDIVSQLDQHCKPPQGTCSLLVWYLRKSGVRRRGGRMAGQGERIAAAGRTRIRALADGGGLSRQEQVTVCSSRSAWVLGTVVYCAGGGQFV